MDRKNVQRIKQGLVNTFGGSCQQCGYDRCLRALQFHHVAERTDKPGRVNLQEVRDFPERFRLLCANCHIEEHDRLTKSAAVFMTCATCGATFQTVAYLKASGRRKYCSYACRDISRKAHATSPDVESERFWAHTQPAGGCRLWTGRVDSKVGIGRFDILRDGKYRKVSVRNFAYELTHGRPPDHRLKTTCGNPLCVEPTHIA